jgi:hypothetical protein
MLNLVQFDTAANAVTSFNEKTKTTSCRLLNKKEFSNSRNLKGGEAKRAFNEYLRVQGKVNTAGLAGALTTGELLVKGVQDTPNGMTVRLVKASSLKVEEKSDISSLIKGLAKSVKAGVVLSDEDQALLASLAVA